MKNNLQSAKKRFQTILFHLSFIISVLLCFSQAEASGGKSKTSTRMPCNAQGISDSLDVCGRYAVADAFPPSHEYLNPDWANVSGTDNWIKIKIPANDTAKALAVLGLEVTWSDNKLIMGFDLYAPISNNAACPVKDPITNEYTNVELVMQEALSGQEERREIQMGLNWGVTYWLHIFNGVDTNSTLIGHGYSIKPTSVTSPGVFGRPLKPSIKSETINYTCNGGDIALTASSIDETTVTYKWMPGNITGKVLQVHPLETTTYKLTASNACSTADTSITITPIICTNYTDDVKTMGNGVLVAYPNPFTNELMLDFERNESSVWMAEIYNATGQVVFIQNLEKDQDRLNLESLQSGFYQLVVKESNGERYSSKIVKE